MGPPKQQDKGQADGGEGGAGRAQSEEPQLEAPLPRTVPLGSLRAALPYAVTGTPKGGALPYLGPAAGTTGLGL